MATRFSLALAALSMTGRTRAAATMDGGDYSLLPIQSIITADPSRFIDPSFPGLAFEQASFVDYATHADGSPKLFSQNLVDAIFARTGGRPVLRLGGTNGDYARYLANQTEPVLPRAAEEKDSMLGNTTIGPAYWATIAAKSFPAARFVVQVPMADPDTSEAVRWAKAAQAGVGLDRIEAFEPGNEPDRYPAATAPGLGPPRWQGAMDNGTYVSSFLDYADAVAAAVGLGRGARRFQALDTASHPGDPQQDVFSLSLRNVMQQGLDNHHSVMAVARHYYQTDPLSGEKETEEAAAAAAAADLANGLMNHGAIAARLDIYRDDIEFLAGRNPKLPYVLSEVGATTSNSNGKHGHLAATLGAALWQVDFQLYGLSLGVARFHFQHSLRAGLGLWLPGESSSSTASGNASAAQVLAPFYAQPFVADLVGASGRAQVVNVPLEPNVAAYVAYEDGRAKRAAIVNLEYWSKCGSSSSSSKGAPSAAAAASRIAQKVAVQVPNGVRQVRVLHLTSPVGAGARANTVTYGGSQWTYESMGEEVKGVRDDGEVLYVQGGTVVVPVQASEAVLIHFE